MHNTAAAKTPVSNCRLTLCQTDGPPENHSVGKEAVQEICRPHACGAVISRHPWPASKRMLD
jgi:hypothetical protein